MFSDDYSRVEALANHGFALMSGLTDRRAFPRQTVVKNQASLHFTDEGVRRKAKAELVNISRNGALILTDERPALHEPLLIRMVKPVKTDWIAAIPIRIGRLKELGISFCKLCPDCYFLAATLGLDFSWIVETIEQQTPDDWMVW